MHGVQRHSFPFLESPPSCAVIGTLLSSLGGRLEEMGPRDGGLQEKERRSLGEVKGRLLQAGEA